MVDMGALETAARLILTAIGEDTERDGLKGTPERFARYWRDFATYNPGSVDTTFESATVDQMVVISGMRIWSVCEHHLLPFWADVHIGYIAGERVMGLSKFARIAHMYAHKPQIQERLVTEIADAIQGILGHDNLAVMASGVHTCMVMRGIKTPGVMTSSVMRGAFHESYDTRREFLSIVQVNEQANMI